MPTLVRMMGSVKTTSDRLPAHAQDTMEICVNVVMIYETIRLLIQAYVKYLRLRKAKHITITSSFILIYFRSGVKGLFPLSGSVFRCYHTSFLNDI